MDVMEYKGYTGSIQISLEDDCLHGSIQFVNDVVTYEGANIPELKQAFQDAVDRYLEHCAEIGKNPDKPFSGTFNIRIGSNRHKAVAKAAVRADKSINEIICEALDCTVMAEDDSRIMRHVHTIEHVVKQAYPSLDIPFEGGADGWRANLIRPH